MWRESDTLSKGGQSYSASYSASSMSSASHSYLAGLIDGNPQSMLTREKSVLPLQTRFDGLVHNIDEHLSQWMYICSLNNIVHYMQLSVIVLYCATRATDDNNSRGRDVEWRVGLVLFLSMLMMGMSNLMMSHLLDSTHIERVLPMFFIISTIFSIALCLIVSLQRSSLMLTLCLYLSAVATRVTLSVPWSNVCRMTTLASSKQLKYKMDILSNVTMLLGIMLGSFIAEMIGYRTVFVSSSLLSLLSTMIVIYYTMVFIDQSNCDLDKIENGLADVSLIDRNLTQGQNLRLLKLKIIKEMIDHAEEMHNTLMNENEHRFINDGNRLYSHGFFEWLFMSYDGLSLFLLSLYSSLRNARLFESIIVWWSLYNFESISDDGRKKYSIWQSNTECLICLSLAFIIGELMKYYISDNHLPYIFNANTPFYQDLILLSVSFLITIASLYIFLGLFNKRLDYWSSYVGWLGLPLYGLVESLSVPTLNKIKVDEMHTQYSGVFSRMELVLQSVVPGLQHLIIGFMWNNDDGKKHESFLAQIAVLHLISMMIVLCYMVARWKSNRWNQGNAQDAASYQPV